MSELLKDKILATAFQAYQDFRRREKINKFIYERDLMIMFPPEANEIPDLLNLLSHPLSPTRYLLKYPSEGAYEITDAGVKYCQSGYSRGEEERRPRTLREYFRFNLINNERPFWQVVLVISAFILGIAAVVVPVMLYLSEN